MGYFLITVKRQISENTVKTISIWDLFDNVEEALDYVTSFEMKDVAYHLYNEDDVLSFDDITNKDYLKGIFVLGYKKIEFKGILDIKIPERPFCDVVYNEEDLRDSLKKFSTTKHLYFFRTDKECLRPLLENYEENLRKKEEASMRPIHFEGDIIITDPCYIEKERDEINKPKWDDYFDYKAMKNYPDFDGKTSKLFKEHSKKYDEAYDKWDRENEDLYGLTVYEDFSKIGFTSYLSHDTLYGDWSCTTYNSDTKEAIGEFCADSGMVSVFLLDEVLKYNPSFDYHIKRPWTTTFIKDFKGTVQFIKLDERTLIVKGVGNINFETRQTGL